MTPRLKAVSAPALKVFATLILVLVCWATSGCSGAKNTPAQNDALLRHRVAQLLMVGFRGTEIDSGHFIAKALRYDNLGGVILFDYDVVLGERGRNIVGPEQLRRLTAAVRSFAATPPLIGIDQEGGRIARLKPGAGFAPTMSHLALGTINDPDTTMTKTGVLVDDLVAGGINLNLAPVVDLCSNPDNPVIARYGRCFSADPAVVTEQAQTYIAAHHARRVLSALKHFPGHGSSSTDSHAGFVDVSTSWEPAELEPYRALIAAGCVDTVMTAHVFNRNLDPKYPATLSRPVITGLLRENLGFRGVVFSDDMQMKAIRECYGLKQAVSLALNAGVDVLVFGNNLVYSEDIVARVVDIIVELVAEGEVSEQQIVAACARVHKLKQRLADM